MKTHTNYTIIIILLLLSSCVTGRLSMDGQMGTANVKEVPLRGGEYKCYSDNVAILARGYEFTVKGNNINIRLTELRIIHSDPDVYIGVSDEGMLHTVYYYSYRGRFYIQISPVPKGFTNKPDLNEITYIISTDSICN